MKNILSDTAASADGTAVAWSRQGEGPAIVLVGAVMASRSRPHQPALAAALAEHFTVFTYDRRGTGDTGEAVPYAVERDFEDLTCMLALAGPGAAVYGFSSGATLALLAAAAGVAPSHLLLVEPPLVPDPDLGPLAEARRRLAADPAAARAWFDLEVTGIPADVRAQFPPLTEDDLANAPAMLHELAFLPGTTAARFAGVRVPTLLLASEHTAPDLLDAARDLGDALPDVDLRIVAGSWHGIPDDTLVNAIRDFLGADSDRPAPTGGRDRRRTRGREM